MGWDERGDLLKKLRWLNTGGWRIVWGKGGSHGRDGEESGGNHHTVPCATLG